MFTPGDFQVSSRLLGSSGSGYLHFLFHGYVAFFYLDRDVRIPTGGSDAFSENWKRWKYINLLPPPPTSVLLHLRTFRGKILVLAQWWLAQPWFTELQSWCPNPLILGNICLVSKLSAKLQTSPGLHVWNICTGP